MKQDFVGFMDNPQLLIQATNSFMTFCNKIWASSIVLAVTLYVMSSANIYALVSWVCGKSVKSIEKRRGLNSLLNLGVNFRY